MFEGGDQEVSVTQLQWLYFASYKLALKLINSSGFLWATSVLDHSRDVCFEFMQCIFLAIFTNKFTVCASVSSNCIPQDGFQSTQTAFICSCLPPSPC